MAVPDSKNLLFLSDLRTVLDLAIDSLEELHGPSVELDGDFFWAILGPQWIDPYQTPTDLTLGQLSELLGDLGRLAANPADVSFADAGRLADLLRAASQAGFENK